MDAGEMSDRAVYESYCEFCRRVGVTAMEFSRWMYVRWLGGFYRVGM
jgi:hypothetical protein